MKFTVSSAIGIAIAVVAVSTSGAAKVNAIREAGPTQPRLEIWIDTSNSTSSQVVRAQYLNRVKDVVESGIDAGAHLRVVTFARAASSATPIIEESLQATGPNSSYVTATKKKIEARVVDTLSAALLGSQRHTKSAIGSDPAGAILYSVASAKAGLAQGTSAAVWIFSDAEATFARTNLVRLLGHLSPSEVIDKWLRPYVPIAPNASRIDLHMHGVGAAAPGAGSTRVSIELTQVWRRFCALAKARSCDVTPEI
jgi:hypothetical protein